MQILRPDYVLTPEGVITDTDVAIEHGCIVDLRPASRQSNYTRRLPGKIIIPGLVNAHSHAFQRAIRGLVQRMGSTDDDFWSWRSAMYGVAGALTPDTIGPISRLAFLEMALGGVTAVGEFHYVHHQVDGRPYDDPNELAHRVIQAARDVGIRIALLRVSYSTSAIGVPARPEQRRFCDVSAHASLMALSQLSHVSSDHVRIGLAPHSVRAVPENWLGELASFPGVVHAHVAEQPAEVRQCMDALGRSPLAVFADSGLVSERFTAVHLTWPSDGDLARLAGANGTVCVCPTTEYDLGDGIFPLHDWRGRVSVGTDSHARIDILEEARLAHTVGRALAGRRGIGGERPASGILRSACEGGAQSLGFESGIAIGKPADLVAIDLTSAAFLGVAPLEAIAFGAGASNVTDVWVGGEEIVHDGHHADHGQILEDARRALAAVRL
ncbi:MAG: formimidoylglutamate deiminase [Myxococcota bacterium]